MWVLVIQTQVCVFPEQAPSLLSRFPFPNMFIFPIHLFYLIYCLVLGFHITEMTLDFWGPWLYLPSAEITSVGHHDWHASCSMSSWHRQESFGKKGFQLQKNCLHQMGKAVVHFYKLVIDVEGLYYCGCGHLQAGGPGMDKKADWASRCEEQVSKQHSSTDFASVLASRLESWVPALTLLDEGLYDSLDDFSYKLKSSLSFLSNFWSGCFSTATETLRYLCYPVLSKS